MSADNHSDLVIIGEFGAPHGLQGYIRTFSSTSPADSIFQYTPWLIELNSQWQPIEIQSTQAQPNCFLVKVKGYEDCDQVRALTNKAIAVKRSQLPPLQEGDYYWSDLVGFTVINHEDKNLGKVSFLFTSGQTDILVADGNRRYMIPFIMEDYIKKVDLNSKTINVEWDEDF